YEDIAYTIDPFDRLREILINYFKAHTNCSNFEMEDRFGKRIMSHLDKLVEQGVLKDKRADLIFQVGSGLFGARKDGKYSEEVFLENAMKPEVKAIELKLAQGAKVRGGKLPKEKI